jgi:hypothetical protein
LLDTENLFINIGNNNINEKDQKPNISKSLNEIMSPPKRKYNDNNEAISNNSKQSSNYERINKEEINIVKRSSINNLNNNDIKNNKILFLKKNESLGNFWKKKYKIQKDNTINLKESENDINDNNCIPQNIYNKNQNQKGSELNQKYISKKEFDDMNDMTYNNQEPTTRHFNSTNSNKIKFNRTNSEIKIYNSERVNLPEDIIQKSDINDNRNNLDKNKNSESSEKNNKSKNLDIKENKDLIEKNNKKEIKNSFNWFNYLYYMISCGKTNPTIKFYEKLRNQIISEENLIKNHLYINKSFEVNQMDNSNNPLKVIKRE